MSSIVDELHSLKNAPAAEIIVRISDLATERQGCATQVRQALSGGANGPKPPFPTADSDKRAVEVAILGILVDEISYAPSAGQREKQLQQVEGACARLNISYDDVVRCSRRSSQLAKIFDGE
jgi:hypothetical protein